MAIELRRFRIGLIAAACGLCAPAMAELSLSSASSESSSVSIGASSTSIGKSSEGSRRDRVAEGEYTVLEVAEAADRPGQLRVKLQMAATATSAPDPQALEAFDLYLPQANPAASRLAQGQRIQARQRPYGVEFAQGNPRQPFFLVLQDAWFQELHSQPVRL